ncbi:MAG: class C sortase [Coprobacillaceae bacterium]
MKKVIRLGALFTLIVGICILLYPSISQSFYNKSVAKIVDSFEVTITNNNFDELYQKLLQENKDLYENGQKDLKDPFSYSQPSIDLTKYGLKENIIGYIEMPTINQTIPIYLGANESNMLLGAVHLTNTSYPIGGTNTNSVIAAHRAYSKAELFKDVDELQLGDTIFIRNFREKLSYKVVQTEIINPDQIDKILIQKEKDMITLMSCHPYGTNHKRYIVYCERVSE